MAGERIEVKVWKNPFTCEDCEFGPRPKCGFQTPCLPADYLPTRQEAIERMAKGLAKYNDPVKSGQTADEIWNECIGEETKSFYLRQAEAALDALIKGE